MVFEQIDKLKQEYTDKFVVVDENRPDLRRFADMTGRVRTVNMNGRALVEFDADNNIGWYDIDPLYLKVVDGPPPAPAADAKPAAKSAAAKPAKPKPAAAKPPATKPAAGGGMSVADILAAARGGDDAPQAAAPAKPKPAAEKPKPAGDKPAGKAPPGGGSMSVADILAAARGQSAPATNEPADTAEPEAAAAPEPPAPEPPADEPPAAEPDAAPQAAGDLPTDTADIVAWCRQHDGA